MGPTFMGMNIIGKRQNILCIALIVLQSNFNLNHVTGTFNINWLLVQDFLVPVQEFNVLHDAAFKVEGVRITCTLISYRNVNTLIQKGKLTNP
ncbi:hypothetical protein D3C81_1165610 [compost metagenome]